MTVHTAQPLPLWLRLLGPFARLFSFSPCLSNLSTSLLFLKHTLHRLMLQGLWTLIYLLGTSFPQLFARPTASLGSEHQWSLLCLLYLKLHSLPWCYPVLTTSFYFLHSPYHSLANYIFWWFGFFSHFVLFFKYKVNSVRAGVMSIVCVVHCCTSSAWNGLNKNIYPLSE